jgi:hypothetical protein
MSLVRCVAAAVIGENSMRTSWRSTEPKGIEDHLKDLCLIYRGEMDNPHDVNALMDEERAIQFLKYNLWDVERSIMETPATWRYLYLEEKGSLPVDDALIARKIYDFAVRKKLERVKEFGIDLTSVYERFIR